jgi:hypothetical protein
MILKAWKAWTRHGVKIEESTATQKKGRNLTREHTREIDFDDLEFGTELARGNFGT